MAFQTAKVVTSSETLNRLYQAFFIDASQQNITFTLIDNASNGERYYFKRVDTNTANTVTIQGFNASDTIEGNTTIQLSTKNYLLLFSFQNTWHVAMAGNTTGVGGAVPLTGKA